jgi:hypothetical protein
MLHSLVSQAGPRVTRRALVADATNLRNLLSFEAEVPTLRCPGGGVQVDVSKYIVLKSRCDQILVPISGCLSAGVSIS